MANWFQGNFSTRRQKYCSCGWEFSKEDRDKHLNGGFIRCPHCDEPFQGRQRLYTKIELRRDFFVNIP